MAHSLQRRVRRGQHDGRMHLLEQRRAFAEKLLPSRILEAAGTRLRARIQAAIGPDVTDLIRLTCLGLPQADDPGIFLRGRRRRSEYFEPLFDHAGGLGAIVAEFVDVARRCRGNGRPHGVEQADVLAQQQSTDQRNVLAGPARVVGEFAAQFGALIETAVAPQMHDLIERADLGHPVAFELAVVVLADVARYGARRLYHIAERTWLYGVGSQLIDHGVPKFPAADFHL